MYLANHGAENFTAFKSSVDPAYALILVRLEYGFDILAGRVEGQAVEIICQNDSVVQGVGGAYASRGTEL